MSSVPLRKNHPEAKGNEISLSSLWVDNCGIKSERRQEKLHGSETTQPIDIMAKTQNSQKQTKKAPLRTPAEKKADKRAKKNR